MWRKSGFIILLKNQAQGATEYLLILAAILVVVTIAVFYLTTIPPSATITGTAEKSGDNVVFTPSKSMIPSTISSGEWEWAIYRDATLIASGSGTGDLARGVGVSLSAENTASGDEVKIKYKGTWHDAATVE